jgi:hypothetical protein
LNAGLEECLHLALFPNYNTAFAKELIVVMKCTIP